MKDSEVGKNHRKQCMGEPETHFVWYHFIFLGNDQFTNYKLSYIWQINLSHEISVEIK